MNCSTASRPRRQPRARGRGGTDRPLAIAHQNVARARPSHEAFLELCASQKVDVVCVTEPAWGSDQHGPLAVTHAHYKLYSSVSHWTNKQDRPRAQMYVRKDGTLNAKQLICFPTKFAIWMVINGYTIMTTYRDRRNPQWHHELHRYTPPSRRFLVVGDFNAISSVWQFCTPNEENSAGRSTAAWAAAHSLSFIREYARGTHDRGNTLDLAFSNVPFASSIVDDALTAPSDHSALRVTLPIGGRIRVDHHRFTVPEDKIEAFTGLVTSGLQHAPRPRTKTPEEIDDVADFLVDTLKTAVRGAGKAPGPPGGSAPWWTEECGTKHRLYKATIRASSLAEAWAEKKAFRTAVRTAKRQYWRRLIDGATSDQDLYRIVAWHKLGTACGPPPLVVDGRTIDDAKEKCEALGEKLLRRFSPTDDIGTDPLLVPVVPPGRSSGTTRLRSKNSSSALQAQRTLPPEPMG